MKTFNKFSVLLMVLVLVFGAIPTAETAPRAVPLNERVQLTVDYYAPWHMLPNSTCSNVQDQLNRYADEIALTFEHELDPCETLIYPYGHQYREMIEFRKIVEGENVLYIVLWDRHFYMKTVYLIYNGKVAFKRGGRWNIPMNDLWKLYCSEVGC